MRKGFTLTEVLIVIVLFAAFSFLAMAIFNPSEEISKMRNVERLNDLNKILDAVFRYNSLNDGKLVLNLPSSPVEICLSGKNCGELIDLSPLVDQKYIAKIPIDPLCSVECSKPGSGYYIYKDKEGRFILFAKLTELGDTIVVIR